jgi:hypothetical protein
LEMTVWLEILRLANQKVSQLLVSLDLSKLP